MGVHRPRLAKIFLTGGLALGFLAAVFLHDLDLIGRLASPLPGEADPSHRLRGWSETAQLVETERENLATNGEPVFVIADHYGLTGLLTFYSAPAKAALKTQPLVYCVDSDLPANQFYFWPEYDYRAHRQGQNALFVSLLRNSPYEKGWIWHWLKREPVGYEPQPPAVPPPRMTAEFESVEDLGERQVMLNGRVVHRVHLWACHHLH